MIPSLVFFTGYFFQNLATRNLIVSKPFWILADVNFHCNYEVNSNFYWSVSVPGQTHILPCKIMYQCLQGVYVDILGCLEFLLIPTTHSIRNIFLFTNISLLPTLSHLHHNTSLARSINTSTSSFYQQHHPKHWYLHSPFNKLYQKLIHIYW